MTGGWERLLVQLLTLLFMAAWVGLFALIALRVFEAVVQALAVTH